MKELIEEMMEWKRGKGKPCIIMLDDIVANAKSEKINRSAIDRMLDKLDTGLVW